MADPILHRYTGRVAATADAADEADNVEDQGGWGLLRGIRDRAMMLELRKKDDTALAIPYALIEQVLLTPGEGITLRAAGREVRVRGRGLEPLFAAMVRHRAAWVAEPSRTAASGRTDGAAVDSVLW